MRFFIVGLGSMGKRRIRCLGRLGHGPETITGFDRREDRRTEVKNLYGVDAVDPDRFAALLAEAPPDAAILSVPPDIHHIYMEACARAGVPFFVEASVLDSGLSDIEALAAKAGIVAAPSATLLFHPAIRTIGEIVSSGTLGKISNFLYHSGQYLPDWHTYESVSDYYVSNPATGGAREITPFELSWITRIFGFPARVFGNVRKTIEIPGAEEIDDTYNLLLDYGDFLGSVTVDVVSRLATRRLVVNGDKKQLLWSWDDTVVRVFDPAAGVFEEIPYAMDRAEEGYNQNIGENMYVDELDTFLKAAAGQGSFPNTLENDRKVLQVLYAAERADREHRAVEM